MTEHSTDERPEHDPQDEAAELPVTESETVIEDGTEDEAQDASTIVDPDASEDAEETTEGDEPESTMSRVERLENEGEIAADYLEELLDIADLDGDLDMDVEGDRAAVSIVGAELTQLVGVKGEVLDALQELTRLAVYRETGERSRLMLDISGHRAQRRETLVAVAERRIAEVKETGERAELEPMTSFERKVVHDAVTAAGLVSESEGVEPRRYVVILPA